MLENIEADYYFFADQDDVWLPEKMEKSLAAVKNASISDPDKTVVCFSDLYVVDEKLNILSESMWKYSKIIPEWLTSFPAVAMQNVATGCTMCFNRKARDLGVQLKNPEIKMHDHFLLLCVLAVNGIAIPIKEPLIYYRQHGQNVCGTSAREAFFAVFLMRKIRNIGHVLMANKAQYLQAKGIAPITISQYIFHKFYYVFKVFSRG